MNFVTADPVPMRPPRQNFFNVPPVTLGLLILLTLVQLVRAFGLTTEQDEIVVFALAFVPVRFKQLALHEPFVWIDLVSYALLHFGWTHFIMNATGLAAFGAAVERLFGGLKLVLILVSGIVAGAVFHFILFSNSVVLLGGISAGISALFAIVLAIIQHGRRHYRWRALWPSVMIWLVLNLVMGLIGMPTYNNGAPATLAIAWIAHIGGFAAGLVWLPILWPQHYFKRQQETL